MTDSRLTDALNPHVLVVDDEPTMIGYIRALLEGMNCRIETASDGFEALKRLETGAAPDLVLMDILMPEQNGLVTLEKIRQIRPSVPVVMLSCISDSHQIVEAMRLGAQDYLTKPFDAGELSKLVARYTGNGCQKSDSAPLLETLGDDLCFVASDPAMRRLHERAVKVAPSKLPVLVTGESGTGKEMIARLVHKFSPRAKHTFLKVNCAAMPSDLLESELFGYEAGAFTGAYRDKPGKFDLCSHGTIFLDEIGEMPPMFQAKLLQVLQDLTFSRLGSRSTAKVDVRVIAATNIDVRQALAEKNLREDLYFRLNGINLHVPPLRERKSEIPVLLKHYIAHYAESYSCPPICITPRLLDACMEHSWPGNVRELCNLVKRALVLRDEAGVLRDLLERAFVGRTELAPFAT